MRKTASRTIFIVDSEDPSKNLRKEKETHVAEITSPILRALLSNPQLNLDLELSLAENLLRTVLIYVLRFAPNQHRQSR